MQNKPRHIYLTSDTHFNHSNIVAGTSNWSNKARCRPFETLEEHDDLLVDNINQLVKENDILYHLGDFSFNGFENILKFRNRLKCKEIHLIYGNHDHHLVNNKNGCQGYFSSTQHYKEIRVNNIKIVLCHYALRVWNESHKGSIMLYGHSHGSLDEFTPEITNPTWIGDDYFIKNYKTMDVGVDTHDYYPYHIDEILDIMKNREVSLNVDHHNEKTT